MRTYLNETWLESTTVMKEKAIETEITTRSQYDATDWITTKDKVFLLSEADVFGTFNRTETTDARDYTYGNEALVPDLDMIKSTPSWLRSPHTDTKYVAGVNSTSTGVGYGTVTLNYGVRPALWVSLEP